jgi:hypothetical protein
MLSMHTVTILQYDLIIPVEYGLMGLAAMAVGKYFLPQIISIARLISKNHPNTLNK